MRKLNGMIPPKREHETETTIKITINGKSLKLVKYESARGITLYIGGHTIYCIYADLIKKDGNIAPVGYLNKVRYDSVCSLENNFMRGLDTNMILKLLLTYISRNYPSVTHMVFNDTSSRTCDNGEHISLANMSYILYGKTWYEKHFSVFLQGRDLETFKKYATEFHNRKKDTTWESFLGSLPQLLYVPIPENELEELYTKSETWHDFFKGIHDKLDVSDFCIHVQPWLDRFMLTYFKHSLMGFLYQMPVKDYGLQYIESPYQRGGKKLTRRALRKAWPY